MTILVEIMMGFIKKYRQAIIATYLLINVKLCYGDLNLINGPADWSEFHRGGYRKAFLVLLVIIIVVLVIGVKKEESSDYMEWGFTPWTREGWKYIRSKLTESAAIINKLELFSYLSFTICQVMVSLFFYLIDNNSYSMPLMVVNIVYVALLFLIRLWIKTKKGRWLYWNPRYPYGRQVLPKSPFVIPVGIGVTMILNSVMSIIFVVGIGKVVQLPDNMGLIIIIVSWIGIYVIYRILLALMFRYVANTKIVGSLLTLGGEAYLVPDFLEKEFFQTWHDAVKNRRRVNMMDIDDEDEEDEDEEDENENENKQD